MKPLEAAERYAIPATAVINALTTAAVMTKAGLEGGSVTPAAVVNTSVGMGIFGIIEGTIVGGVVGFVKDFRKRRASLPEGKGI